MWFSIITAFKLTQTLSLTSLNFSTTLLLRRFLIHFEGTCTMTGSDATLTDVDVLTIGLRDVVAEYDSAMLLCVSLEEVEDLEEEDAAKIVALVKSCRGELVSNIQPVSQWTSMETINGKTIWVQKARKDFQAGLDLVMADYLGEDEEEEDVGDDGPDSDMD